MASKKLFLGLVVSLLVLAGNVQSQSSSDNESGCNDSEAGINLPVVNVTLTVFSQNPQFVSQISGIASQIGGDIAQAIAAESASSIPIIGGLISSLSSNLEQTVGDITNLLTEFGLTIGQEVEMAITQAAISNFNANIQTIMNGLQNVNYGTLDSASDDLWSILNIELENNYQNFLTNPTFSQYAYYTAQPLFVNAYLHMSVLTTYTGVCQLQGSACSQQPTQTSQELYSSYVSLLGQYASNATNYRSNFMSQTSDSESGTTSCPLEGNCEFYEGYTIYTFDDTFTGYTDSEEDNEGVGSGYEATVNCLTGAFFNGLTSSFSNAFSNSQSITLFLQ